MNGLADLSENKTFETGFTDLDYVLNIKNKGNLIVIGGRPAIGKTNLALNIISNIAKNNIPIALFSLELSKKEIINRMACSETKIDYWKIKENKLKKAEFEKVEKSAKRIINTNLYIDDTPGITIEEIKEKSKKIRSEKDIGLIVIDYLQLIDTKEKYDKIEHKISYISKELKIMAKELDVNIILTTQLPRFIEEREDRRPIIRDLLQPPSRAITQNADIIMFIYRDDYYNPDSDEKNIAEITVAKNGYGNVCTIKLLHMREYCKFTNMKQQE